MKNLVFLVLVILVSACGKVTDFIVDNSCSPAAVADAGADQYIAYDPDPTVILPLPDRAQIGTPQKAGLSYHWEPAEGLSDQNVAQPIAKPVKNTVYTLSVKSERCGTEKVSPVTVFVMRQKMRAEDMSIVIGGERFPTGYTDLHQFVDQYRASYLHMGTGYYAAMKAVSDVIDLTPPGFHVNRQPQGSCWAEGARSCGEATYFYVTGKHEHISTQRIIDCSGFGSAGSGGQISVDDFVSHGLVKEADYPYNGHDNRCKKDVLGFYKAKSTFVLRDKNGGRPKMQDLLQAHQAFGASEDCGSAGALGSGGYMKNPGGGSTNHCWGGFGIRKHPTEGWYCRVVQNSWGTTNFGGGEGLSPGQGCYGFKSDGSISTGIIAENKFVDMGSPCPPPKADAGPDKTILLMPNLPDFAVVGVGGPVVDHTYQWSVISGDMSAYIENPISPVTLVRVKKSTRLKLTVKNKCAEAHAEMKITVWSKDTNRGVLVEVK